MAERPPILCIGSVLWDVIGRTASHMTLGSDVPGRITREPGGVAMNIAMTLRRFGLRPALLTVIGRDEEGRQLLQRIRRLGLIDEHIYLSDDLPTDLYMAIEGANGLTAAIADAHSLEAAGAKILRALTEGPLGSPERPYGGIVAIDGNLTEDLLAEIAQSPSFAAADLRLAPASPGKAERLLPLLDHPGATLYVNLEEAGLLLNARCPDSATAAQALHERGARRVLVTHGACAVSDASASGVHTAYPPGVLVTRVTGAGDTFLAAHIVAEMRGDTPAAALDFALQAAAAHVSGDTHL